MAIKTKTGKLKKTSKKFEKIMRLSSIVKNMDDNDDYEEAFNGYFRDFSEFMQTNYDIDDRLYGVMHTPGVRNRLGFAKGIVNEKRKDIVDYGASKINDIVKDLDIDGKLEQIAASILPIKNDDMDKANDLDGLINDYEESVDTLEDRLNTLQERTDIYREEKKNKEEYEEYVNLLKDYKGLVSSGIKYMKLASNLSDKDGKPNEQEMSRLFNEYLDHIEDELKVEDKDKYEDNKSIINVVRNLASSQMVTQYYAETFVKPAEKEYMEKAKEYDLKEYVERNFKVKNPNDQMNILNRAHSIEKGDDSYSIDYKKAA